MTNGTRRTRRALLAATAAATATSATGCLTVTTPADRAAATTPRGRVEYFVGSPWLAERRDSQVVLDARPRASFRQSRIYGARRVPLEDVTSQAETETGSLPAIDEIANSFGALGIAPDDDIVVYGQSVGARVTRTVFALAAIGHRGQVRILNGGLDGWTGRVGTGPAGARSAVTYEPDPDESQWVTRDWLAERVGSFNDDGPGLVDVRHPDRFLASTEEAAPDFDRGGHLPGAVNVHWHGNIDGTQLGEAGQLFQLYNQRAGIDPATPVVVYGDDNVNATQTWVTLRAIGYDDVRVFDGGFAEWANVAGDRGRYPVETKTDAVIETESGVGDSDGSNFSCTG